MKRKVGVVGAGPGGLAAGLLLLNKGFEVDLFEASDTVGGRNARLELGEYKFDVGPTFFLMPQVLEEVLSGAGGKLDELMDLKRIEPMYQLDFADGSTLDVTGDPYKMSEGLARFSRADGDRFWSFRERQARKFEAILPALRKPFAGFADILKNPGLVGALPFLDLDTVYDELGSYFEDERTRLAFTFQAKYLGMSPFECPSLFTILPHIEHALGVWHPIGGCSQISQVLARQFIAGGGRLHLNAPVRKARLEGRRIQGLELEDGRLHDADFCVMNADFAYGMSSLFPNEKRRKYKDERLEKYRYSCSTFMLYLGVRGELPWPHHKIYFSQNYRRNIRELTETQELSADPSFYVHNPSRLDPTLAPAGDSAVYVLVPVPNLDAAIDWRVEGPRYRKRILDLIEQRTGVDLRPRIEAEKVITPLDWREEFRVYKGATFSLAHTITQMLQFRPHNACEDFDNLYIVGGGTHPGSGLPTILQSSLIAADLIQKQDQKNSRGWKPAWLGRPQADAARVLAPEVNV